MLKGCVTIGCHGQTASAYYVPHTCPKSVDSQLEVRPLLKQGGVNNRMAVR